MVDDDDTAPTDDTIYDIQGGSVLAGSFAEVEGVIVTGVAINTSGEGYGLFAQEPGGGQESGIWVYTDTGAEAFAVGDVVDVSGWIEEYDGLSLWSDSVTEINVGDHPSDSSVVPSGPAVGDPAAVVVSPGLLSTPVSAEAYEGVLVQIASVAVVDPDLGFGEWSVTDGVRIDDKLFDFGPVAPGDTFTNIVGVLDYTFDDYKLQPRSAADFVGHTVAVQPIDVLSSGELIVTEFMANPGSNCNDADDEYLELRYVGAGAADLQGLTLSWGANDAVFYTPMPVSPGDYVLLVREAPSPCYGHSGDGVMSFALTNGGDLITVSTASGTVLDTVDTTGWDIASGQAHGLNPTMLNGAANDSEFNWCLQSSPLATDFGTPGAANDPC